MDRLKLFRLGYSWGGVTSLAIAPDVTEAPNARAFGDRLVRFYVGLEATEDLVGDLEHAFRGLDANE
jgi:cysteine-S-conjugate beta-lyase